LDKIEIPPPLPHQLMGEGYTPLPSPSDGASKAVYSFPFVASNFRSIKFQN